VRGDLNNAGKYYSRDIPNYAKNASQGIGNIGSAGPIGARDFGYQGQLKPNFTEAQTYDYGNYGDYTKSFKFGAESRPYTDSFKPEGPASFKDVNIGEQGVGQYGYKGQVGDYGKATFGDYDLGSYGGYGVKGENYSASIGKASHGVGQVGFSGDDYSFDGRVGGFGKVGGDYNIGAYGMTGN